MARLKRIQVLISSRDIIPNSSQYGGFYPVYSPGIKTHSKRSLEDYQFHTTFRQALRDDLAGLRSFHVSRFRIIYRISSRTLEIIAVGPRERIYEETYRLIKKEV